MRILLVVSLVLSIALGGAESVFGQTQYFDAHLPDRWTFVSTENEDNVQREFYTDESLHEADVVIEAALHDGTETTVEWAERTLNEFAAHKTIEEALTEHRESMEVASGEVFEVWKMQFVVDDLMFTQHFAFHTTGPIRYLVVVSDSGLSLETDAQGMALSLILGNITLTPPQEHSILQ